MSLGTFRRDSLLQNVYLNHIWKHAIHVQQTKTPAESFRNQLEYLKHYNIPTTFLWIMCFISVAGHAPCYACVAVRDGGSSRAALGYF